MALAIAWPTETVFVSSVSTIIFADRVDVRARWLDSIDVEDHV